MNCIAGSGMEEALKKLLQLQREIFEKDVWKKRQTVASYYKYIIEEAKELEQAVLNNDAEELKEELGDLLWNILVLSHLAEKEGLFNLKDVLGHVHQKMIERHPHIINTKNPYELTEEKWNVIKQRQKERKQARQKIHIIKPVHIIKSEEGHKKNSQLPTYEEALGLFDEYHVPKRIQAHCEKVSELAWHLAQKIQQNGIPVDVELTRIGALLHDWMKAATLHSPDQTKEWGYAFTDQELKMWKQLREQFSGKDEEQIGAELLQNMYPSISQFLLNKRKALKTPFAERAWEVKIVHYADWRVQGTTIVPLAQRMEYIFQKYKKKIIDDGTSPEILAQTELKAEQEICAAAGISPEDLEQG